MGTKPRARRPAVDPRAGRAGCSGGDCAMAVHADGVRPPAPGAGVRPRGSERVAVTDPPLPTTGAPCLASPASAEAVSTDVIMTAAVATGPADESAITIYVCTTCRGGRPLDLVPVPGAVLAEATERAAVGTAIAVRRVRCLANCNRGLSAAMRRDGAWTYVFGHLDPATGARVLIDGARLFAGSSDGLMPWRGRPEALKRGLVARTPPFDFAGEPQ